MLVHLFALALTVAAPAHAAPLQIDGVQPALVDVLPTHIFAPQGFDDNDNVQIVLEGALPNTCYKIGPTEAAIDAATHKIRLRQQAYRYSGTLCAEVMIPYIQPVNLGVLPAGEYEIEIERDNSLATLHESLPIAVSTTSNADDFVYAPVTDLDLDQLDNARTHQRETQLTLHGRFTSSCMRFKELRIHVRTNHVIEVLPIIELKEGVECAQVITEFSIPAVLSGMPSGRYLVHVRSLNGVALNRILDI